MDSFPLISLYTHSLSKYFWIPTICQDYSRHMRSSLNKTISWSHEHYIRGGREIIINVISLIETSNFYAKETISDNGYWEYMEAELSLFTLNAEIQLDFVLNKLRDWAMQILTYLGTCALKRGKSQSNYPTVESRTKENSVAGSK